MKLAISDESSPEGISKWQYRIQREHYQVLLEPFGDLNPVHTDEDFAKKFGFSGNVMHGAILGGFLSHFVGMVNPGAGSLILSQEMRFAKPCFLNDEILITTKIVHRLEAQSVLVMEFNFANLTQKYPCAWAKVTVKTLHE